MRLRSWLKSLFDTSETRAANAKAWRAWEYAQANDWELLEADPAQEELETAARLQVENPEAGFRSLLSHAEAGSPWAMGYVAWCYGAGNGVSKDLNEMGVWYHRAYEAGSDRGMLQYGSYLASQGRTDEAADVFEAGWRRGFLPAVFRLIDLRLKPDLPLAERLAWKPALEWAAAEGHPVARVRLTQYLFRDWFGRREIPRGFLQVFGLLLAIFRDGEDGPIPI